MVPGVGRLGRRFEKGLVPSSSKSWRVKTSKICIALTSPFTLRRAAFTTSSPLLTFAHPRLTTSSPSPGESLMARRSSPAGAHAPPSSLDPRWARWRTFNRGPRGSIYGACPALDSRASAPCSLSLSLSQSTAVKISVRPLPAHRRG